MVLKGSQVKQLLDDLCVHVGFCLPLADQLRLQDSVPSDPDAFTDAVFRAEGLDPSTADATCAGKCERWCGTRSAVPRNADRPRTAAADSVAE